MTRLLRRAARGWITQTFGLRVMLVFAIVMGAELGAAFLQARQAREQAEDEAYQNMHSVAGLATTVLAATVNDAYQVAETLRLFPDFWEGDDDDRSEILHALAGPLWASTSLRYFTDDFQEHGASTDLPGAERASQGDRPYAVEAVRSGRTTFAHQAVVARGSGNVVLPVVIPVRPRESGTPGGYLIVSLNTKALTSVWTGVPLSKDSAILLMDGIEGRTLGGTGRAMVTVNAPTDPAALEPIRRFQTAYRYASPVDGVGRLRAWEYLPDSPWIVAVETPAQTVFAPIAARAREQLALALIVTIVGMLLLSVVWLQLSSRLRRLAEATAHWSSGNWAYRTDLTGRDELSRLGASFDSMAAELASRERLRTEAERARSQLASIVESADDAILSTTPDGIITSWNAGASRLFGYSQAEAVGQPISIIRPLDRVEEAVALEARVRASGHGAQVETVRLAKDGRGIPVWLTVSPLLGPNGELEGFAAITRDISERYALERMKDEFVSTVSHELRTPLNGVIGMTDLLRRMELPPQQRQYVDLISESGTMLLRLINDILDFSKIEAGKLEIEDEELNLHELIQHLVSTMGPAAQTRRITLEMVVGADVPRRIRGDVTRLRQVLSNLLVNAVKFTHEGSVALHVQRVDDSDGGPMLRFEVVDTGIGISPDAQHRLFEAFSQVNQSTTRNYGGTGLGLAICKRLVELMGGTIWVESAPGKGSTFAFTTPCRAVEQESDVGGAEQPLHFEAAGASASPSPTAPAGARILVADDSPIGQQVARQMLERLGYHVSVVVNGREAVDAAPDGGYAAVLMDCEMPEMDGFTATAEIRRREGDGAHVPIVGLTANALKGDRDRCLAAGMDDYLTKPVLLDDLAAVLRSHVRAAQPSLAGKPPEERGTATETSDGASALVDQQALLQLQRLGSGDNAERLDQFIQLFIDAAPSRLTEMERAVRAHDHRGLYRAAHALKGEAAMVGARHLTALCAEMERHASDTEPEETTRLLESVHAAFEETTFALRAAAASLGR